MTTRTKQRIKLVRIKIRTTCGSPINEVFAYIVDAEKIPQWQSGVVRAWYTPSVSARTGSSLQLMTSAGLNKLMRRSREGDLTVTDCQSESVFELTTDYGPFRFRTRYLLEPTTGSGTKLNCEFEGHATEWGARMLLPVVTRVLARRLAGSIRSLKAMLENQT